LLSLKPIQSVQPDSIPKVIPELETAQLSEPEAVQFSFETIGWKILGIVLLITILILIVLAIRAYIKNRYRRDAVKKIENQNNIPLVEIFKILKLTSIRVYGRSISGSLYGQDWLTFLERTGKKVQMVKFEKPISDSIYKDEMPEERIKKEIIDNSIRWIKTHAGKL